jgi:hypothetical protein
VRQRRDYVILLGLLVVVAAFVAYEEAGLRLDGWHTISYFSQHNLVLFIAILVLIPASGLGVTVWWWFHIRRGRILK